MKKRFAIFFMLIHLFMVWEQEAIAVENISIESINLYQVYIRIKEGCTEPGSYTHLDVYKRQPEYQNT